MLMTFRKKINFKGFLTNVPSLGQDLKFIISTVIQIRDMVETDTRHTKSGDKRK